MMKAFITTIVILLLAATARAEPTDLQRSAVNLFLYNQKCTALPEGLQIVVGVILSRMTEDERKTVLLQSLPDVIVHKEQFCNAMQANVERLEK